MAEAVKPTRAYNSPRRREQAAATRREILEAAKRLFEQQGYAATTMAADRRRGRCRAQDRVRGLRDQERRCCARCGTCSCAATRTTCRSASAGWYRSRARRARPRAPAAPDRAQLAHGQGARRRADGRDPQRRADRPRHRGALGPDPVRLLRQPARDREGARTPRRPCARGSTSPAAPTSCGRSTTPTCGSCWSASAAGLPTSASAGSRDTLGAQLLGDGSRSG